jgi:hypothetical protein
MPIANERTLGPRPNRVKKTIGKIDAIGVLTGLKDRRWNYAKRIRRFAKLPIVARRRLGDTAVPTFPCGSKSRQSSRLLRRTTIYLQKCQLCDPKAEETNRLKFLRLLTRFGHWKRH